MPCLASRRSGPGDRLGYPLESEPQLRYIALVASAMALAGIEPPRVRDDRVTALTIQRRQVLYSGHVQGVGFRYTAQSIARGYDVLGYVRNMPDGRVELVAEGSPDQLDSFLHALAERMGGHIHQVTSDIRPAVDEFARFEIRY